MFCILGGNVLLELGEKTTILGDRVQQTRLLALTREVDIRPRAAGKPRGPWLELCVFLGLVNTDYGGILLYSLF